MCFLKCSEIVIIRALTFNPYAKDDSNFCTIVVKCLLTKEYKLALSDNIKPYFTCISS